MIFPAILVPSFLGEFASAWLLVKGVNVSRWEEKARAWRVSAT